MTEKSSKKEEQCEILRGVLSDSFVVYMKTIAVHWNYHGPKFFSVHKLTEGQYQNQAEAIDEIAERVRALGGIAPISLKDILADSNIAELTTANQEQDFLVSQLVASNQTLAEKATKAAKKLEELGDLYSHDMVVQRIGAHEKAAWMLHSQLE